MHEVWYVSLWWVMKSTNISLGNYYFNEYVLHDCQIAVWLCNWILDCITGRTITVQCVSFAGGNFDEFCVSLAIYEIRKQPNSKQTLIQFQTETSSNVLCNTSWWQPRMMEPTTQICNSLMTRHPCYVASSSPNHVAITRQYQWVWQTGLPQFMEIYFKQFVSFLPQKKPAMRHETRRVKPHMNLLGTKYG